MAQGPLNSDVNPGPAARLAMWRTTSVGSNSGWTSMSHLKSGAPPMPVQAFCECHCMSQVHRRADLALPV